METRHTVTFLGTGAGGGVPAFFCECAACQEARVNPRARRGCCGIMIEKEHRLLIDTPPDLRHQLIRENVKTLDKLIFTHEHYDHTSGLGELEYMMRLVTKKNLPVSGSAEALKGIREEFGYLDYTLDYEILAPFSSFEYDGATYTALPVVHAPGTFGYLVETPKARLFYASDTSKLSSATAERVCGVDHFIIDATYWKDNWTPKVHNSAQQAIEEGFELGVGTIYLTHLAMHYAEPVTLEELEDYVSQYDGRVIAASDGMKIEL